jgi:transcriptional regulator with XRE-family HTH domain
MASQADQDKAAGAALRELRKDAGLSQEELAAAANVDQSILSKVERLGPSAVRWAQFCRIARELGYGVEISFKKTAAN